jgi:hypothetical protein
MMSHVDPIIQNDEKQRIEGEQKDAVRAMALETIRGNIGPFFPTGCQQNLMDATCRMQIAPGLINKSLRALLGKLVARKRRQPIERINKTIRVLLVKNKWNRMRIE